MSLSTLRGRFEKIGAVRTPSRYLTLIKPCGSRVNKPKNFDSFTRYDCSSLAPRIAIQFEAGCVAALFWNHELVKYHPTAASAPLGRDLPLGRNRPACEKSTRLPQLDGSIGPSSSPTPIDGRKGGQSSRSLPDAEPTQEAPALFHRTLLIPRPPSFTAGLPERWPSGRRRSPAKGVYQRWYRGFESHPLRHERNKNLRSNPLHDMTFPRFRAFLGRLT